MTTIQVKCVDQNLQILNSPLVASGGLQETAMQFDFCSKWDGLGKTAVFYKDKSKVYNVVLDNENKCLIPDEVIQEAGRIYFGVYGVNESKRKTTFILKYDIMEGAFFEGEAPSEPTPNIYEQLMTQYNAINTTYNNIFNNLKDTVADMSAKGFVNLNTGGEVVGFWVGTKAEYEALEKIESGIHYIVTDEEDPFGVINLGKIDMSPNSSSNSVLNACCQQRLYSFVYNDTTYLMFVYGNEEWCQQRILNLHSSDGKGNMITVITRLLEDGEVLSITTEYYASVNYVDNQIKETKKYVDDTAFLLYPESNIEKIARQSGLYSVEIIYANRTTYDIAHSVLMYVDLYDDGTGQMITQKPRVISQIKYNGTWYEVEVECFLGGGFNLRVDADIKGVFELGDVRLVKKYV